MRITSPLVHLTLPTHTDVITQNLLSRHPGSLHGCSHYRIPLLLQQHLSLLNLNGLVDAGLPRFFFIIVVGYVEGFGALGEIQGFHVLVKHALQSAMLHRHSTRHRILLLAILWHLQSTGFIFGTTE